MNKHFYSLDYLRGFAAVSVCLFHFSDKFGFLPTDDPVKWAFSGGHFGVEIFFIISGLVIPYSMAKGQYTLSKVFVFLKKRFIRIEPPYLLCVLLALALNYATTLSPVYVGKPFNIDYEQLFYHIGYLNGIMGKDWLNQVFWTLAIEFQYYLLIAVFFPFINHKNWLVWGISLIAFNASASLFDRNFVFNFAIFFTTGILLYRYLADKSNRVEVIVSAVMVLGVLAYNYSYKELLVTIGTVIAAVLPLRPTWIGAFFGNISYSLYLLHFPIGLRIINLAQRFSDVQSVRQMMVFVALLGSVFVAYFYYKYVEKPFKLMSARVKYDTKASAATRTVEEH
ncbi:Peptidoglycan/LPS O-acetylase OafA/YrhL, contains acyltransferase and SGNH-hydrolase domains [Dyadobacter sp. SG02]|uniref:acyltransferase family protein n=1 Tax=Dyadobacter sp. SG02 TaxID=1855291 RepID=UPI0008CB0496|nr:acyltransferase [Dyadobacter sp. SG02]SEJ32626.1 Peptidoglycan/LPS O-acetylase OafA/YrhL, contains acyltransferase and SGNH-hydrolase domains [Dyadobacter sp. SG02]